MSAERKSYIDKLRMSACLFVILLHCISQFLSEPALYGGYSWETFNIINSVCRAGVPLFFMISGYLTLGESEIRSFSEFYAKRSKRLLVPLTVWNAVYYLYFCLIFERNISVGGFLRGAINEGCAYHLWFLYTMLAMSLAAPFLKIISDRCSDKQLFGLFLLSVFPTTIRPFINMLTGEYIYLFDSVMGGYIGYYLLGLILGRHTFLRRERVWAYICGVLGILICIFGNRAYSSAEKINLVFNGGYSINNYLVAAAIFVFAKEHLNKERKFVKILSACSFGVYLIHALVLDAISRTLPLEVGPTFTAMVYFICTVAISFSLILAFTKIKRLRGHKNGFL